MKAAESVVVQNELLSRWLIFWWFYSDQKIPFQSIKIIFKSRAAAACLLYKSDKQNLLLAIKTKSNNDNKMGT